jgi:hypothetical protein
MVTFFQEYELNNDTQKNDIWVEVNLCRLYFCIVYILSTLVMIGIDCTRSCKSNYVAITTTTLLPVNGIPNPLLILNGSSM